MRFRCTVDVQYQLGRDLFTRRTTGFGTRLRRFRAKNPPVYGVRFREESWNGPGVRVDCRVGVDAAVGHIFSGRFVV